MHVKFVVARSRIPQPTWAVAVVMLWASLILIALLLSWSANETVTLCWFRKVFGVPCLTCGGTRSTLSLLQGRWLAALEYNPLVAVGDVLIAAWLVSRVVFRRSIDIELTSIQRYVFRIVIGLALVANWVYVFRFHMNG